MRMGEGRQEHRITGGQDRPPVISEVVDYSRAGVLLENELRELAEGGITEETMSRDWQPAQEQKFSLKAKRYMMSWRRLLLKNGSNLLKRSSKTRYCGAICR